MKTSFFAIRCIVVVIALILFSGGFSGNMKGETLARVIDEIVCSDVIMKVFTEHDAANKAVSFSEYTKQHLLFADRKTVKQIEAQYSGTTGTTMARMTDY